MLLILIELSSKGQAWELKEEEELQFLAAAYCKNLGCKFPAHPGNHRARAHNTHTQKQGCNSAFLVCPVLFLFFWQYLLCLFIFQRLQQEHGGLVITVSELLNHVSNSVEITWGLLWSFFFMSRISWNKQKTIKQKIKNQWGRKISFRKACSSFLYPSAVGPYVWPATNCGYKLQGRRLNAQFETFQHTCQCSWGTRWWRINRGNAAALRPA